MYGIRCDIHDRFNRYMSNRIPRCYHNVCTVKYRRLTHLKVPCVGLLSTACIRSSSLSLSLVFTCRTIRIQMTFNSMLQTQMIASVSCLITRIRMLLKLKYGWLKTYWSLNRNIDNISVPLSSSIRKPVVSVRTPTILVLKRFPCFSHIESYFENVLLRGFPAETTNVLQRVKCCTALLIIQDVTNHDTCDT